MSMLQFYADQAAEQRVLAESATLDNVRERCERAARAWDTLATRTHQLETLRAKKTDETLTSALLGNLSEN
jgi:hypothetical protein